MNSHPPSQTPAVNLLSASDLHGGAGIAAFRLLRGLENLGVNVNMFVQDKRSCHPAVLGPRSWPCKITARLLPYLDPLPKLFYSNRHRGAWSCGLFPNPCLSQKQFTDTSIVHLHWVSGGFVPLKMLATLPTPIVWTLHDSWPFTGGCHIPYDCQRYQSSCGHCPQLRSGRERDLSRVVWEKKSTYWNSLEMTIVAPSRWLASLAKSSSLFGRHPIKVIPNGLDLEIFTPLDKMEARRQLALPSRGRLIMFNAFSGLANWNKGGDLLQKSLQWLSSQPGGLDASLLLVGSNKSPKTGHMPIPVINYGVLDDEKKLRLLYSAADLTVVPSRSESLGYVAMESMACGTPCVGFAVGGLLDIIDHKENGYLAEAFSVDNFSQGIRWLLEGNRSQETISMAAREKIVANFDCQKVAQKYVSVYQRIAQQRSSH